MKIQHKKKYPQIYLIYKYIVCYSKLFSTTAILFNQKPVTENYFLGPVWDHLNNDIIQLKSV